MGKVGQLQKTCKVEAGKEVARGRNKAYLINKNDNTEAQVNDSVAYGMRDIQM